MPDRYPTMHEANYAIMRDALQIASSSHLCNSASEIISMAASFARVLEQSDATMRDVRHANLEEVHHA